jgi:hypothetical protein
VGVGGEAVFDPSVHENGSFVGLQADIAVGPSLLPFDVHGYESMTSGVGRLNDFQYGLLRGAVGASPIGPLLDACRLAAQAGGFITKNMVMRQ